MVKTLQALFGIVQGARQRLAPKSASFMANRDFDGFGIGGVFDLVKYSTVVNWSNSILPADKPRHLLGMASVQLIDLFWYTTRR